MTLQKSKRPCLIPIAGVIPWKMRKSGDNLLSSISRGGKTRSASSVFARRSAYLSRLRISPRIESVGWLRNRRLARFPLRTFQPLISDPTQGRCSRRERRRRRASILFGAHSTRVILSKYSTIYIYISIVLKSATLEKKLSQACSFQNDTGLTCQ